MNPINPLLGGFMGNDYCVLVEDSPSIAANLQRSLQELGMPGRQIVLVRRFDEALKVIPSKKPRLIITEFEIEGRASLELIDLLEQFYDESECLRVVLTNDKSENVIAAAAEEQIDVFLIKPFSMETFAQHIDDAIFRKQNPSEYIQKIQLGKKALKAMDYATAETHFMAAMQIDKTHATALYFLGLSCKLQNRADKALTFFREGLKIQPLNYKCLIAEFNLLVDTAQYLPALGLIPNIVNHYPVTDDRLLQIYKVMFEAKSFGDLVVLHPLFIKIERRSDALIALATQAYFEAFCFFVEKKNVERFRELLDMLLLASSNNFDYIEKAVKCLLKTNHFEEAKSLFKRISAAEVGSPRYKRLEFAIEEIGATPDVIVEKARKLIFEDNSSPEIFESAVLNCKKLGKKTLGETMIAKAVLVYPDLRSKLYKLLEEN